VAYKSRFEIASSYECVDGARMAASNSRLVKDCGDSKFPFSMIWRKIEASRNDDGKLY
jgi:hypothetical protein